ncbi:MAG: DUF3300 domain-containing protein [Bryobacteraceae bacterium]|nr:DUF3300 domain-containing protein [Bryobacteraceae bacterium]
MASCLEIIIIRRYPPVRSKLVCGWYASQFAGNLKSTSQQKVKDKGTTIVIEPAAANTVYVPQYDPSLVYGYPLAPFREWYSYPGLFVAGPGIG